MKRLMIIVAFCLVTVALLGAPVAFHNIIASTSVFTRIMGAIALVCFVPMILIWAGLFDALKTDGENGMTARQADTSWILEDMGFKREPNTVGGVLHSVGDGVFLSVDKTGTVAAVRETGRGMVPINPQR